MTREGIFLGQLQAFIEVVRLGNVTRAADSLFLTQPALSARLTRLEQEVGVGLLIRNRRGARLTEAGRAFLPYAKDAIASVDHGQAVLRHFTEGATSELALGATPTFSTYVLPTVLKRMLAAFPRASLTLRTATSEDLIGLLGAAEIHIALCRSIPQPGIDATALFEEELVLIADRAHRLATRRSVSARDLADEVIILYDRSASYHAFIESTLRQADVTPRSLIDVDNSEASKRMIREGIGITLLPRTAVAAELLDGSIVQIKVEEMNPIRRTMAVLRRKDEPESPLVPPLLRLLHVRLAEMGLLGRPWR